MKVVASIPALAGVAVALAACQAFSGGPLQTDAPLTDTPYPTSTIVWFPATATAPPTALPVKEPTPEMKPGVGHLLLTDDFSSASLWNTAVADQAAVAVAGNRLTIAVQPGAAPVASFRSGSTFGDLYFEITARPGLCRDGDDYGLVFRAPNHVAYYRFALSCNGTAAADRVSLGTQHVLQPPTLSGDVPLGAPGSVRLGVWAVGSEFRFFLNGRYQFTASDMNYRTGMIGVFAQAAGDTPATVTFSDLTVYAASPSVPAGAPTP